MLTYSNAVLLDYLRCAFWVTAFADLRTRVRRCMWLFSGCVWQNRSQICCRGPRPAACCRISWQCKYTKVFDVTVLKLVL